MVKGENRQRNQLECRELSYSRHLSFFFLNFIFNCRIIALNIVLVSAIHQHESAIGIHISFPS